MAIEDSDIDIIIITNLVATDLMNMFEFYRIFVSSILYRKNRR